MDRLLRCFAVVAVHADDADWPAAISADCRDMGASPFGDHAKVLSFQQRRLLERNRHREADRAEAALEKLVLDTRGAIATLRGCGALAAHDLLNQSPRCCSRAGTTGAFDDHFRLA